MGFFKLAEIKKAGLSLSKNALSSSFSSEHLAAVEFGHRFLAGGYPQQCSAGIAEPELASGIWYQLLAELIHFLKLLEFLTVHMHWHSIAA